MKLEYQAVVVTKDGPSAQEGNAELTKGALHVKLQLPEGKIRSIKALTTLEIENDEKIFMNGYQTWTHSPEWGASDHMKATGKKIPGFFIDQYALDKYGDYHFMTYPDTFGRFHGFSWCYFRKGDRYRLVASLNERPGYTIFRFNSLTDALEIERDCGGVLAGGDYEAFDLFYWEGSSKEVFDAWFNELGIKPRTDKKLAGYDSWYNRYGQIDCRSISNDLEGASKVLRPGDLFLIDEGWQMAIGDWDADFSKFPGGMKSIVEDIKGKGLVPGLWIAPFSVQNKSKLFKDHPEWAISQNGNTWCCGCNWGPFFGLDIENYEVRQYLKSAFDRIFGEWGFEFIKADFLYTAAPFGTERDSRAGRMIKAMEFLRELCGDHPMLASGVPLMPAFGIADYCRIGNNVGIDWDGKGFMRYLQRERVSTKNSLENTVTRRQLNGRAFLSDPDVIFLRDENLKLSEREKETLYTTDAMYSGMLLCSDDMGRYDAKKRETYDHVRELFANAAPISD